MKISDLGKAEVLADRIYRRLCERTEPGQANEKQAAAVDAAIQLVEAPPDALEFRQLVKEVYLPPSTLK